MRSIHLQPSKLASYRECAICLCALSSHTPEMIENSGRFFEETPAELDCIPVCVYNLLKFPYVSLPVRIEMYGNVVGQGFVLGVAWMPTDQPHVVTAVVFAGVVYPNLFHVLRAVVVVLRSAVARYGRGTDCVCQPVRHLERKQYKLPL